MRFLKSFYTFAHLKNADFFFKCKNRARNIPAFFMGDFCAAHEKIVLFEDFFQKVLLRYLEISILKIQTNTRKFKYCQKMIPNNRENQMIVNALVECGDLVKKGKGVLDEQNTFYKAASKICELHSRVENEQQISGIAYVKGPVCTRIIMQIVRGEVPDKLNYTKQQLVSALLSSLRKVR